MQKKRYDPQQTLFTDTNLMAGDAIFIDLVTNLLKLVGDQEMGLPIQQLNGIHKLESDITIVL
jgi:hypothetical protein